MAKNRDPIRSRPQPKDEGESSDRGSVDSEPFVDRKVVSFEELAGGHRVVAIDFNGQRYQLRLTKSGRLVLTK